MSGIAGVGNLDGRPADETVVAALAAGIAHRGPDALGQSIAGPVALACHLLRGTSECAAEQQPASNGGANVLVCDCRLDNREELLYAITGVELTADSPVSALALAAWRQWGDASLARLYGDFALAAFNSRTQSLL